MTTDQADLQLSPGMVLTGKWHGHRYRIIRKIGSGAQGTVYLAANGERAVALKIAKARGSLISEANVLKELNRSGDRTLAPHCFDLDDWITGAGKNISICAMELLKGKPLIDTLPAKSFDWSVVYLIQLLGQLQKLHHSGYVFGDLKPENLMLTEQEQRIRCLDFGGATRMGRSIREYTEFYDRGYWGLGTRKAEPSYDLFACAMILIYATTGKRFEKSARPGEQLLQQIRARAELRPYQQILSRALTGKYQDAMQMRRELLDQVTAKKGDAGMRRTERTGTDRVRNEWLRALTAASLILAAYIILVIFIMM
ncbi:serine/threonine protein kinase [Sporolactobacillus vineae]|uniref:serine/threonine protein kinase n=1 Tax=Sporolactobacillus vineae TaxID=444463 RepID=UPI000289D354|nr:protein kinase [Sporolactobacillus vineae]